MATAGDEFLARPDVSAALDDLFGDCFEKLERGGPPDPLPDVREFMRDRGIEVPAELKLEMQHRIDDSVDLEAAAKPMAPICDEQGTRGYTECREAKGKIQCYWVCPWDDRSSARPCS